MKKLTTLRGKVLTLLCMVFLLALVTVLSASAETVSGTCGAEGDGSNLTWTLDTETGILTISGTGSMTNYSDVPAPWEEEYCDLIQTIIIKDGVTSIGDFAFYYCTGLTSIEIPSSVTRIGVATFLECGSLASVDLPFSLISIGDMAYGACGNLASIAIPSSLTSIGERAFASCSGLAEITVAEGNTVYHSAGNCIIKTADKVLIAGCKNSIIPTDGSVTGIGDNAFYGCSDLTSIKIPSSVTSIGEYAFSWCSGLTSIEIPSGVTSMGKYAFNGCSSLESITFLSTTTEIYDSEKTISPTATIYGYTGSTAEAYATKYDRTFVALKKYWQSGYCGGEGDGTNLEWGLTEDGQLDIWGTGAMADWSRASSVPWYKYYPESVLIKDGVTSIGDYTFVECSSLTSIEIPSSVTSIGDYAFQYCERLTSITIPDSVTSIGDYAFQHCQRLTSITIPDSVINVGDCAFRWCYLESITFLSSTTEIYDSENTVSSAIIYGYAGSTAEAYATAYSRTFKEIVALGTFGDNLTWKLTKDGELILSGTGKMDDFNYLSKIFTPWHPYFASITSVTIKDGITNIGCETFYKCNNLESVKIPSSVTSIEDSAFNGCSSLESVEIPSSVTRIGDYAFNGCSSLESVEIPSSVTSIGDYAFNECSSLESITFLSTTSEIYNSKYTIPADATIYCYAGSTAEKYATAYSRAFRVIVAFGTLIDNLTWKLTQDGELIISGKGAMEGYYAEKGPSPWGTYSSSIISVTIKDGVTNIAPGTFKHCSSLKNVKIPSSVTSIEHEAFYECSSLESVEISEGVTSIGQYAFYNCSSLTSIEIPSSVTRMGSHVFSGCSSLASITVAEENAVFHSEGNCLIATESKTLVTGCKNSKIPDDGSVTSIRKDAFYDCSSLESINIPSSVMSIETNAFFGCNNLAFITVAEGNTIYHSEGNCLIATESKTLVIGCKNSVIPADGSVTNIGDYAFYRCSSLASIEIPSGVTSIGDSAFSGCSSLTSIEIPSGVTSIGNSAFSVCSSLTSIEIPFGVTSIGSWAFYECSSLTSIEIPSSVASIGNYAFEDCNSLASIEIPSEVMSIGDYAFACCGNLTSVVFAEESKCESIGSGAFYECSSLTSFEIPSSVTNMGFFMFWECSNLKSIEIPASVTSIGDRAFGRCFSLTSIEIPSSVTSIGAGAFSGCSGLTGITFLSSTTEIDDYEETIPTGTTIHGYAGSTAEAYATTYGRTFVPFATDTTTVFEFDVTFTPETTQVGVYTPVASLNRVGADSSETLDFLYVEGSTGALVIKQVDGVYQPLYDALGEAVTVGKDETSVAVVYDNVNGLARYYINGSIPYYGESMALANDVSVCNAEFCKLEAVADTLTALDSVSVSHVYNINQSGTADFIGIQQKEGDTTTVRILSGVDMLYYGSIGFEVELFCDGQSYGSLSQDSKHVYTSITASGEPVSATDYGYRYFSMLTVEGIDMFDSVEYHLIVRTYTQIGDKKYYGATKKINMDSTGFSVDNTYAEE